MNMLTSSEKDHLMDILSVIFRGQHTQFYSVKNNFDSRTLELVEQALSELIKCNNSLKSFVTSLIGGAALVHRGWLRNVLKRFAEHLKDNSVEFDGLACQGRVAINYKTAIFDSAL